MSRLVLLTDRSPEQALPAILAVGYDVKVEPLSVESLSRLPDLGPEAVLVDAAESPSQSHALLEVLAAGPAGPVPCPVPESHVLS